MDSNVHVVTSPCIGTKDAACAKACPVSCFYDAGNMLIINPSECIGCSACAPECPVAAIFPWEEVPAHDIEFIDHANAFFMQKGQAELDILRVES